MEVGWTTFNSFFRQKEAVLVVMHDSVIEIELHVKDDNLYLRRFFCDFGPCLKGFREGCKSYLSVDFIPLR
jgi:hypothetical protein